MPAQVVADRITALVVMGASSLWHEEWPSSGLEGGGPQSFEGGQPSWQLGAGQLGAADRGATGRGGLAKRVPAPAHLGKKDEADVLPLAVTDGTACSGGTSLSLMQRFQVLTAVEVDDDRISDLRNNIQLMVDGGASDEGGAAAAAGAGSGCGRLVTYHADYVALSCELAQVCVP